MPPCSLHAGESGCEEKIPFSVKGTMRAAAESLSATASVVGVEQLLILCWALQTEGSKLPRSHDEKISHPVRFLLAFGTFCGIPSCFSRFMTLKNRHLVFVHPLIACRKNWFNLKYCKWSGVSMVVQPISDWGGGALEGQRLALLLKGRSRPGQAALQLTSSLSSVCSAVSCVSTESSMLADSIHLG